MKTYRCPDKGAAAKRCCTHLQRPLKEARKTTGCRAPKIQMAGGPSNMAGVAGLPQRPDKFASQPFVPPYGRTGGQGNFGAPARLTGPGRRRGFLQSRRAARVWDLKRLIVAPVAKWAELQTLGLREVTLRLAAATKPLNPFKPLSRRGR